MIPGAAQTHTVPEIMTLAEAAAYLRLSKSTLYQRKIFRGIGYLDHVRCDF
jgi:hypothetical protein